MLAEDAVTRTEIDLNGGVIRKTWKLMGFAYSITYELDNNVRVQIKDKSIIFEGYNITLFEVYLTSRGMKIRISSTDDLKEALLIESQIIELLKGFGCPALSDYS